MKKNILFLVLIMLFLVSLIGCAPDDMPNNTTEAINGLYSDNKGEFFCIIYGTKITVSERTGAGAVSAASVVSDVFEFTLDNGTYHGSNEEKTISFKLNGDRLYLNSDDKTYSLLLDRRILFDEESVGLNEPNNINAEASQIFWYWRSEEYNDPYESGIMNACIKITSAENELSKCEHIHYIPAPASMFLYNVKNAELAPGEYRLSVQYVGGLYVNHDTICQSSDSESVTFSLTVTENNDYIILLGG